MPPESVVSFLDYIAVQYEVFGSVKDFVETNIDGLSIVVSDTHPTTIITDEHFVIEIYLIRLKWNEGNQEQKTL